MVRHCDSDDIIVLVCHMISEDNVVNGYVNLRVAVPHFMSPTYQV